MAGLTPLVVMVDCLSCLIGRDRVKDYALSFVRSAGYRVRATREQRDWRMWRDCKNREVDVCRKYLLPNVAVRVSSGIRPIESRSSRERPQVGCA